jgi:hypothetical protein
MPYITFVVKGSEQFVRERMLARGIVAQTVGQTRTETVFSAGLEYRDAIATWFNEHDEILQGYGYPDGTCLIYSTHDDSAQPGQVIGL